MNWIKDLTKKLKPKLENLFNKKSTLPDNLWTNCASCSNIIYREDIENNLYCCTNCQEPQQILPRKRFEILFDEGTYEELETPRLSSDPLNWSDISSYKDKVKKARKKFNQRHAALVAVGSINKMQTVVYCMNQKFLGGSVGIEEGEAFVFACKYAVEHNLPFIAFPQTGGQKMQHSAFALMQMPKSIIGLKKSRYTESQIVKILKEVEGGRLVKEVCREYSVSDATYYNWKAKYGGMEASDIKRLKDLEDENRRLKSMFAELSLEHRILKDIIEKKL